MSDDETRQRRRENRKKNIFAKILFDPNEFKGAYSTKVIENKKKYKREKLSVKNISFEEDNE